MRQLLRLLVVPGLALAVLPAFAVPIAAATELSRLSGPTAAGTHALLPPSGDPSLPSLVPAGQGS